MKEDEVFFDNNSSLDYEEAMSIIKIVFAERFFPFPYSHNQHQYCDPHGYWGITISKENLSVFLGSERSFIDYKLTLNGNDICLGGFDDRVLKLKSTSKKKFSFSN